MFTFDVIVPGAAPDSGADARTLGVEVTDRFAAARCGLGIIDPQHALGARADAPAAIEACLDVSVPPKGARIVTIRPDLDSVGAMALLSLRSDGRPLSEALRDRVRRIAAVDRFDRGPWPGVQETPATVEALLAEGIGAEMSALAAAVSDRTEALGDRVQIARHWLETGATPAIYAEAARLRATRLVRSLTTGATRVEPWADGRIGVAISLEPGILSLAYRLAPVVVALNPAYSFPRGTRGRKYTVARWAEGDADLDLAAASLAVQEPGWGGQRGIKGSPQERPSRLLLEYVIEATEAGLPLARKRKI